MKFADKSGHQQAIGLMAATLGAVLFSTKAVLVKLAFTYMVTPETLLTLRLIVAAPICIGAAIHLGRGGPPSPSAGPFHRRYYSVRSDQ